MTRYVLGFMFSQARGRVALIRKKRPVWQAGRLNGIGGHIEDGESPVQAMQREFMEETGVDYTNWNEFLCVRGKDYLVYCFKAFTDTVFHVNSTTDEEVEVYSTYNIISSYSIIIPNLAWIIPLALDLNTQYVIADGELNI